MSSRQAALPSQEWNGATDGDKTDRLRRTLTAQGFWVRLWFGPKGNEAQWWCLSAACEVRAARWLRRTRGMPRVDSRLSLRLPRPKASTALIVRLGYCHRWKCRRSSVSSGASVSPCPDVHWRPLLPKARSVIHLPTRSDWPSLSLTVQQWLAHGEAATATLGFNGVGVNPAENYEIFGAPLLFYLFIYLFIYLFWNVYHYITPPCEGLSSLKGFASTNNSRYFSLISSSRSQVASSADWFPHHTLTNAISLVRKVFILRARTPTGFSS